MHAFDTHHHPHPWTAPAAGIPRAKIRGDGIERDRAPQGIAHR